jgi:hypothetical protein
MEKKPDRLTQESWDRIQQTAKRILDFRGGAILDIFRETFGMENPANFLVVFAIALRDLGFRVREIEETLKDRF